MNVLERILNEVREDVAQRRIRVPQRQLIELAGQHRPPAHVLDVLRAPGTQVIAEIKRASPSRGQLARIGDPAALAVEYAAAGAAVISVLTERRRFHGSLDDLRAVRAAVGVPVLRKDFLVCEYQVWEARAYGADLVLLIAAALEQSVLVSLVGLARELGLAAVVEVHDEGETGRAVDAGAEAVGVNARDLRTFDVDRGVFGRLAPLIPKPVVRIAESGVWGPGDVADYCRAGADAVLVGEALVTSGSRRNLLAELVAAGMADAAAPRTAADATDSAMQSGQVHAA